MQLNQIFNLDRTHPVSNVSPDQLPQSALFSQITRIDRESRKACIQFLRHEYPTLSRGQARKLVSLTNENNFRSFIFIKFGRNWRDASSLGWPYIWLLNALQTGSVQYLYSNGIWQIHWDSEHDVSAWEKYSPSNPATNPNVIKYLITYGPYGQVQQELSKKNGLVFYSYSDQTADWQQYPFPEDVDLSCSDPYLSDLKAP